jgi:hypothetical protein
MFRILKKDPRLVDVLDGNRDKAVRKLECGDAGNVFVSADLTAASDLIP